VPKIMPVQSLMMPPVQVGVIPAPGNTDLDVDATQTRLRKIHCQSGFDNASPVLPQPNPQVIAPTLAMPELPIRVRANAQNTMQQFVALVGAVTPPSPVYQFPDQQPVKAKTYPDTTAGSPPVDAIPLAGFTTNEVPAKKRPVVGESCHNPSPQALPQMPLPADLSGVPARKLRQPDAGPMSPPWSTTNWVREDSWGNTLSFLPSRPVRTVQPQSYACPLPIPNPDLINAPWNYSDVPQPKLRRNIPVEPQGPIFAGVPVGFGSTPLEVLPRPKRDAQTPSVGIITALLPTYANAWGTMLIQPDKVRQRVQDALTAPPLLPPGLATFGMTPVDVFRRGANAFAPVESSNPIIAGAMPFFSAVDVFVPLKRRFVPVESPQPPLYFFSPIPVNLAVGLDVSCPLARFAPWRLDWTVAPPWSVFIGLVPDPAGCFDPILLGKTVTRHATYLIGTVTQLPGKVRLGGKPYDLSNSLVSVAFTRPDGTTFTQPVTVYNAPGGLIYYHTLATDFNMVGVWSRQWLIVDGNNLPPYPAIQFTVAPSNPAPTFFGPASVQGDWVYIDNPEPLRIVNPDGTRVCVENALRRTGEDVRVTDGDFEYSTVTTRFHVWKAQLGDFVPQNRAKCTDKFGVDWFIEKIDSQTFDTRYVLNVRIQAGRGM